MRDNVTRTFALRFGSGRDALAWKDHFEKAKNLTSEALLRFDPASSAPPQDDNSLDESSDDSDIHYAVPLPATPNPKRAR